MESVEYSMSDDDEDKYDEELADLEALLEDVGGQCDVSSDWGDAVDITTPEDFKALIREGMLSNFGANSSQTYDQVVASTNMAYGILLKIAEVMYVLEANQLTAMKSGFLLGIDCMNSLNKKLEANKQNDDA